MDKEFEEIIAEAQDAIAYDEQQVEWYENGLKQMKEDLERSRKHLIELLEIINKSSDT